MNEATIARAKEAFEAAFGAPPERLFAAPGRVNLIGEHTDYNDGFVLPCAIDRTTVVAASPATGTEVELVAADLGSRDAFDAAAPIAPSALGWSNYVRGVAAGLAQDGYRVAGARLAIAGDVPLGAGLSSSAALEMASGLALASLSGIALEPATLARIGQQAEHAFAGVKCGIMDQLASVGAQAGHALLIDCRSLETRQVSIPNQAAVLIVDSGVRHAHAESGYNARRQECDEAARLCGVTKLRDIEGEIGVFADRLDPLLLRRARHVVTENRRVHEAVAALAAGDFSALGRLLIESHFSMRDDFEITVPPVDHLADLMNEALAGIGGARMTGGGFGGCVIAVAPNDRIAALQKIVAARYRTPEGAPPTMFVSAAVAGARELTQAR